MTTRQPHHRFVNHPKRSDTMIQAHQLPEAQRQRCEVWTRVMGYHRPVAAFNPGKQSEHHERQHFTERAAARSFG